MFKSGFVYFSLSQKFAVDENDSLDYEESSDKILVIIDEAHRGIPEEGSYIKGFLVCCAESSQEGRLQALRGLKPAPALAHISSVWLILVLFLEPSPLMVQLCVHRQVMGQSGFGTPLAVRTSACAMALSLWLEPWPSPSFAARLRLWNQIVIVWNLRC